MARKLRVQFEGAIYHVTLRGVERRAIFTEDRERHRFLDRVADGVETHDVRVYLYCLMGDHEVRKGTGSQTRSTTFETNQNFRNTQYETSVV